MYVFLTSTTWNNIPFVFAIKLVLSEVNGYVQLVTNIILQSIETHLDE